jgi:hypothetical protein
MSVQDVSTDRVTLTAATLGKAAAAALPAGNQPVPDPRPVPAQRVAVPFAAADSGVGELTWGQMEMWLAMTRMGWLHLGGAKPLPPGTTVAEIAEELRYLMTRFPSMRTRLRFTAGERPIQELFGSGEIVLEVYDADDPHQTAELVKAHYETAPRDYVHEWPVRMAVVRHRGELTHMVVIMCHLVTDGAGGTVMLRDVATRETAPVQGMQQLDLARWQGSEAGRRHNAAALRYWEKLLTSVPPRPYPASDDWCEPRNWGGAYDSPLLYLAAPMIAERTQTDSASVLLALYAIALGRLGVLNPAVIRPLVHNRFRPGLAETVCTLVQSGIVVLDVAGVTVDEAVRRAKRATLTTWKYAYFDPETMNELFDRVAGQRGEQFGLTTFFNDRRTDPVLTTADTGPVSEHRLKDAATLSAFHWTDKKDNPFERLFVHVEDGPESIVLNIAADTHHISPAAIEGVARAMEAAAFEAAFDPLAPTGVKAPTHA